jgi:hypothetical protein
MLDSICGRMEALMPRWRFGHIRAADNLDSKAAGLVDQTSGFSPQVGGPAVAQKARPQSMK